MSLQARFLVVTVLVLAVQCDAASLMYYPNAKNSKAMLHPQWAKGKVEYVSGAPNPNMKQANTAGPIAAEDSSVAGRSSGRKLQSTRSQLPTSLAQGSKVDFSDGGIGTQQENTEDAIAADVSSVAGRFSGRKLQSALSQMPTTLAQGKKVDFSDGGIGTQQENTEDAIAADVHNMASRFAGRKLRSSLSQLPTTLAQGSKVDFSNGGIGTQQENTEDAIAADVSSVAGRFSGRKLLSSLATVPPSLAQGKSVDFVDGGLDSQEDSAVDNINADMASVSRQARP